MKLLSILLVLLFFSCGKRTTINGRVYNFVTNEEIISFFPNPTNDLITIQSNQSKLHSIEIYDLSGKKVFEQNGNESHAISLHLDLNNGTYIIQVKT